MVSGIPFWSSLLLGTTHFYSISIGCPPNLPAFSIVGCCRNRGLKMNVSCNVSTTGFPIQINGNSVLWGVLIKILGVTTHIPFIHESCQLYNYPEGEMIIHISPIINLNLRARKWLPQGQIIREHYMYFFWAQITSTICYIILSIIMGLIILGYMENINEISIWLTPTLMN